MVKVPDDLDQQQTLIDLVAAHLGVPPGAERPLLITRNSRVGSAFVLSHPGFNGRHYLPNWIAIRNLDGDGFVSVDYADDQPKQLLITSKGLDAYGVLVRRASNQQTAPGGNPVGLTGNRALEDKSISIPALAPSPIEVFFAYSHKDESLLDEMREHLALLKREGRIADWHDRKIEAGEEWGRTIDQHLLTSDLILLLISASFISSDYCFAHELRMAINRHEANEARVVPVILRPCDWKSAPFGKLQALPRDGSAVTIWANRDEAWVDIATGIRRIVESLAIDGAKRSNAEGIKATDVVENEDEDEPGLLELLETLQEATMEIWTRMSTLDRIGTEFAAGADRGSEDNSTDSVDHDPKATLSRIAAWLEKGSLAMEPEISGMRDAWARLGSICAPIDELLPLNTSEDRERAYQLISIIPGAPTHFPNIELGFQQARNGLQNYRGKSSELNRAVKRMDQTLQEAIEIIAEGRRVAKQLSESMEKRFRDFPDCKLVSRADQGQDATET